MANLPLAFMIETDGQQLEAEIHGSSPDVTATIVMLHEGLGSVAAWKDWPAELARETGLGVLVYSRAGYGRSSAATLPRPVTYMHHEAIVVLPAVLDAAKIRRAILLGHSDGASIAIIHAGSKTRHTAVAGLALLSPHVFVEDRSIAGIEAARVAYEQGDLRARLAKYHRDVDGAFWGWNRIWLDRAFRPWNIEEFLPHIDVPVLAIQEDGDPYGTLAQIEAIARLARGPTKQLILKGNGHFPQRECRAQTTDAVIDFARTVLAS